MPLRASSLCSLKNLAYKLLDGFKLQSIHRVTEFLFVKYSQLFQSTWNQSGQNIEVTAIFGCSWKNKKLKFLKILYFFKSAHLIWCPWSPLLNPSCCTTGLVIFLTLQKSLNFFNFYNHFGFWVFCKTFRTENDFFEIPIFCKHSRKFLDKSKVCQT